jgi:uncharacterized RDD family membrane protein YckC
MSDLPQAGEHAAPYARFTRRLHALALDAILYSTALVFMVLAAPVVEGSAIRERLFFGVVFVSMVLYEPILVVTAGGTLGHRWANLKVVDRKSGANLGILRALVRFLVKALIGWLSFVTMAFTRRHQAIHDLVTGSFVYVRDPSVAAPTHYVPERPPVNVTVLRRVTMIIVYNVVLSILFLGAVAATESFISERCWLEDVCTSTDSIITGAVGLAWLVLIVVTIALGWRGHLPGARKPAA